MIPKVIHTVFGMKEDFGGKPFSLIHYLAIRSMYAVNDRPDLRIYYTYEPSGPWWDRALRYATPVQVDLVDEVFGVPLKHPAHRTDVYKLMLLQEQGGIALDLDVVCLKPFPDTAYHGFVMAREEPAKRGFGSHNSVYVVASQHARNT